MRQGSETYTGVCHAPVVWSPSFLGQSYVDSKPEGNIPRDHQHEDASQKAWRVFFEPRHDGREMLWTQNTAATEREEQWDDECLSPDKVLSAPGT